jgi:alpha-beta hydrolase superfamily lysophospholipase
MPLPSTSPKTESAIDGRNGRIVVHEWAADEPTRVVVIAHGYGEHAARYAHVADALVAGGAAVYAPDHFAHGLSDGPRALYDDLHDLVADLDQVVDRARAAHPGLPVALIGHSMGGIIAARYAQTAGAGKLDALVLSGPAIGGNPAFEQLLGMDPIPEIPIDPAGLSRDPAVGEDYASDDLVYHGPFQRATLAAMLGAIDEVKAGPGFGDLPLLWVHGELDPLAPLDVTQPVVEQLGGPDTEKHVFPGAMHEVFNETNRDEVIGTVTTFLDRVLAR